MALYDYEIHLASSASSSALSDVLDSAGLVGHSGQDTLLSVGGRGEAVEYSWAGRFAGMETTWQILSVWLEPGFEIEAGRSIEAFVAWVFECAERAGLDVALVPLPSDAPARVRENQDPPVVELLSALTAERRVPQAYPMLFLSERWLTAGAVDLDYYRTWRRAGVGTIAMFAQVAADGSFDILDSSTLQLPMVRQLDRLIRA